MVNNCPNFSLPEWKDLEEKLGPIGAMQLYRDNNEQIPEDFTKAPNGEQSKLIQKVKNESGIEQAYKDKALAYSREFNREVGNWTRLYNLDSSENLDFVRKEERDYLGNKLQDKLDENYEPLPEEIKKFRSYLTSEDPTENYSGGLNNYQQEERLSDTAEKIEILKSNFNVNVQVDPDIQGAGQIEYSDDIREKPTIKINPNYTRKDTVFHEGGHLYIDLLGGMDSPVVQEGVQMLKGSKLEEELKEIYPDLNEQQFNKELLATAIGREAEQIFDNRKTTLIERFKQFIEKLFNELKSLMGLPVNRAKQMARELNTGHIRQVMSEDQLEAQIQEQREQNKFEKDINQLALDKEQEIADKAVSTIERRISAIKKELDTASDNKGEKFYETAQEQLSNLRTLVDQMSEASNEGKIVQFINSAKSNLKAVNQKVEEWRSEGYLDDSRMAKKVLDRLDEKIRAYQDIVNEIQQQLDDNPDLLEYVNQNNVYENFKDAAKELEDARKNYDRVSFSKLKDVMATIAGREYGDVSKKAGEEFDKYYRKQYKDKTAADNAKQAYVFKAAANKQQEIYEAERERIGRLLRWTDNDIDGFSMHAVSMRNLNDDLIARAVEMLDNIEYENMKASVEKMKDTDDVFQRFAKEKPQNNQVDKYDELLEDEVDDNLNFVYDKKGRKSKNTRLISEHYLKFYDIRSRLAKKWKEIEESQGQKAAEQFNKNERLPWLRENAVFDKKKDRWVPKEKWKNPQYKKLQQLREQGSAIPEMYDHLIEMAEERDSNLPDHAKLGKQLPYIQKEYLTEQAQENGVLNAVKDQFKQAFGIDPTDTQYGEMTDKQQQKIGDALRETVQVSTDIAGKETKNVPIFYRKPISKDQQSFDLPSIMLLDWHMSNNYKKKTGIVTDLNALSHMMYYRGVQARTPLGFAKMDGDKPAQKQAGESNAYKALQSIIEDRVYNIKTTGNPQLAQYMNALRGWTSKMLLVGNWGVTGATLLHGKVMKWVEKHAKEFFNKKEAKYAERKYIQDLSNGSLISDFGRRRWYSWTNLIVERFDVMTDWQPVAAKFADDSRFRQLFKSSTLHTSHTMPEHQIQATTAISVLENKKVKDKDGNYIEMKETSLGGKQETGNTTTDRSKAMTLADAYKIETETVNGKEVNTGRLKLDDRVAEVEGYESYGLDMDKIEKDLNREIKMVNMSMYGNYDKNNQAKAERHMLLGQAYMLRGWLVPGVLRRFRGIQQVFPKSIRGKELDEKYEMFYNRAIGRFEEGTYVSTLKYLGRIKSDLKNRKFEYGARWDELTDHQKSNVIRTTLEFSAAVGAYIISRILSSLGDEADEDEENYYYTTAFFIRRLYSELAFYANPLEFFRLLQSPAATMSMIERLIDLINQTTLDAFGLVTGQGLERYERTEKEGDAKILYDLLDVGGLGYSQLNRDVKEALEYLEGEPVSAN